MAWQHEKQWLQLHGVPVPVPMSKVQRGDLQVCFAFLDADGSGTWWPRRGGQITCPFTARCLLPTVPMLPGSASGAGCPLHAPLPVAMWSIRASPGSVLVHVSMCQHSCSSVPQALPGVDICCTTRVPALALWPLTHISCRLPNLHQ